MRNPTGNTRKRSFDFQTVSLDEVVADILCTTEKPVELLYKSLAEVRKEVGKKDAPTSYEQLEKERQRKLEMCRTIRNELLMQGYPYIRATSPPKNHNSHRSTPSKTPQAERQQSSMNSDVSGSQKTYKISEEDLLQLARASKTAVLSTVVSDQGNLKVTEVTESPLPLMVRPGASSAGFADNNIKPKQQESSAPLPALNKLGSGSAWFEGRNIKSAEQAVVSKSGNLRGGRHKRSHSLPLRAETPKATFSDVKSEKITSRTGSSMGNSGRKSSLSILDLAKNVQSKCSESTGSSEMPSIERKINQHVSFGDVNNNNFKTNEILRPPSVRRRRYLEKKKLVECKKVFDKIQAQYKDPEYCLMKYKQIIDNSIERELREQEVKKVQRRIEEGFEMWQDKVLMLQWLDIERAEEQVSRNLTTKMEHMRQKHRNKDIVHSINLNKVKEDDDIRAEILRRELEKKERKIQVLQEEKDRVICESKSRALAVSELKEQLRNIMTPETFDQKVNKCGREKKVIRILHPPAKCPTIMQQSHISLG